MILIMDDFLTEFEQYQESLKDIKFEDIPTPAGVFLNISLLNGQNRIVPIVESLCAGCKVILNFIRKSPLNQKEPNYIHTDIDMGDYTCLFYLNSKYPFNAGTTFYRDKNSNRLRAFEIEDCSDKERFEESIKVQMRKNRMLLFPSSLYHSRSMFENFEVDGESRLVQVLFLKKIKEN